MYTVTELWAYEYVDTFSFQVIDPNYDIKVANWTVTNVIENVMNVLLTFDQPQLISST